MNTSHHILRIVQLLLLVGIVFLGSCTRDEQADDVLVVYSAGPRGLAEEVISSFSHETGIRVELFAATSGQIMAKLEAERYNPRADVVILASRFAAEWLKREDRLLPYRPATLIDTPESWHDPDSAYLATSAAAVGIAVHQDYFDPTLDWNTFFSGRFHGRAIMPAPSRSGSSADFVLTYLLNHGESGWREYKNARQHGLEIAGANSQAMTNLLIGSHQAVVGAVDYLVYREIARGEPIVMHFPAGGVAVVERPIAILVSTRRPDLARRFVDHYFSDSSQQQIAAAHLQPAVRSVPLSDVRQHAVLPAALQADLDDAMHRQRIILRRFQYEVERAVILQAERTP